MSDPLKRLVSELSRLPSIGSKTANRIAHHLLRVPRTDAARLSQAILDVKDQLFHCSICNAITDVEGVAVGYCT